jgi:hypothetical protein
VASGRRPITVLALKAALSQGYIRGEEASSQEMKPSNAPSARAMTMSPVPSRH